MWWKYALLSALFASATALLAKKGVENMDSDLATGIRTVVILIIVWGIVFAKGTALQWTDMSRRNVVFLVASGIATGLSWLFYFKALQLGNVSQVAPVDKLSLALTVIFAVVFLGEPLTLKTTVGTVLILAGTVLLLR